MRGECEVAGEAIEQSHALAAAVVERDAKWSEQVDALRGRTETVVEEDQRRR